MGSKKVNFKRLLSAESCGSNLSSDSCEYYQMEIFDQLPSIQGSRPEVTRSGMVQVPVVDGGSAGSEENLSQDPLPQGLRDMDLRNLPMCMQGKRRARKRLIRERRKMQIVSVGFWKSWRRRQSINMTRWWEQMGEALSSLLPWQHTLHIIEGRFGVGVKAYFIFLRYLLFLNLLYCMLVFGFIVAPTVIHGRGNNNQPLTFEDDDSVLDFFLGSGYLARSPVFFAFYTPGSLKRPCLNTPLLFFIGIFTIFLLSLIMVVRRTTVGYKLTWMLGRHDSLNLSNKIFCGWDFTIQDLVTAGLKHSFMRNNLKLFLQEQSFFLRKAQRTLGQKVRLYLLRFVFNMLVLSLLAGAFYLIYFSTKTSLHESGHNWLVSLILQYLPPMTITFINLVLPHIFRKISSFEDYSFTTQVNTTLVRSIFLKLASLGIYLLFVLTTNKSQQNIFQCKENQFGREMYKLCIFNFLATFCSAFMLNYPRKLVWEIWPNSLLARFLGKQEFLIPFNVLDLVYSQTVSWVGVFYCPLLPVIGTVTLVATFYIKKFDVLRCCAAGQRMFRASSSSVLFHFMLLLGLLLAAVTLGFNLQQHEDKQMFTCGPFKEGQTVLNVTVVCVNSLPSLTQTVLRYLTSEAFALPLVLAEMIILTSYVSRGRANQKAIERLKDLLVMSSADKRFLVKQHATLLRSRRHRNRSRVRPAAAAEED